MLLKYFTLFYLSKNVFTSAEDIGINVGTVLFTPYDNQKKCWTNEQLALLHSRYVFQDILPTCEPNTLQNDKSVGALLNYFRMALNKVKTMTSGKTKQIHLMALTDTIGGYLHHILIPITKNAFYMGTVTFASADKIEQLYDEMKTYLRTDGKSWSPPVNPPGKTTKFKRYVPTPDDDTSSGACSTLIVNTFKNHDVIIPMPFLDSRENPTSIAMPFKDHPLRKLKSRDSENILSKFYDTAMKCMQDEKANKASVDKFNNDFAAFLSNEVIPHTKDDELYPVFGGVFPLLETVKNGGQPPQKPAAGGNATAAEGNVAGPGGEESEAYESDEDKTEMIMFIAVAIVIIIWIITGMIYCCCRMRRKKTQEESKSRSSIKSDKSLTDIKAKKADKTCSKESLIPTPPPEKKESKEKVKIEKKVEPKPPEKKKEKKPPEKKKPKPSPPPKKKKSLERQKSGSDDGAPPCPKCGMKHCKKHQKVDVMKMPSTTAAFAFSSPILKAVKSSSISTKPGVPTMSEKFRTSSSTSTDKPVVFGYDFETSTSESSSYDDDTSSYGYA